MIGLYIKIPFHAQLRASEPGLAKELAEAASELVSEFAATRVPTEESFFFAFDESSRPCRLRAAEAARKVAARLAPLAPRLHGWLVILDRGEASADEALRSAKGAWFGIPGDGLYATARSRDFFADFFRYGPSPAEGDPAPVIDFLSSRPLLPEYERAYEVPASCVERLVDALSAIGIGQSAEGAVAVLGPGRGPALCLDSALASLYGPRAARFLRLRASYVDGAPYGPLASGLAGLVSPRRGASGPGALLPGAERGLLEDLGPMLGYLLRSPYRMGGSAQFDVRLRVCTAASFRYYAREARAEGLPPFLLLEGVERFPGPGLSLVLGLAAELAATEGLVVVAAGAEPPRSWEGLSARSLEVPGPGPAAIAEASLRAAEAIGQPGAAASLAMAAAGDPQRLRLALRIAAAGGRIRPASTLEALVAEALETLPFEYAELLLMLRLAEEALTDECAEAFLSDFGFVRGARPAVVEALRCLGLLSTESPPRIAFPAASARIEAALPDDGRALRADFAGRVLGLWKGGAILPSAALFRRMKAEGAPGLAEAESALALDSIGADAVYGPSCPGSREPMLTSIEPLAAFLAAYSSGDREGSLAAATALAGASAALDPPDGLAAGVARLAKSAFEYAEGRAGPAAALAKDASIALHAIGAGKAEARAHRILGLCALAQEQTQEGADYLSNAYEMALSVAEPLERILAAISSAAADLVLGDLGRAAARAEAAEAAAAACFRADWESAAAFAAGRIALEAGRGAAAEECFGRVRAIARVYGQAAAARRAEIWTGRAAAYAGETSRAREMLARVGPSPRGESGEPRGSATGDAEALWFLAEAEAWDGEFEEAAATAASALGAASRPRFASADAFDWGSGFASLEGRAVGFAGGAGHERSYLMDQIEAFREYARGMAASGPSADEAGAAAADRLAIMAREDRIASVHPSIHLYLFYRYRILERRASSSMEAAATLSKAFKALQTRATRLSDASLKNGFLEANRWNRSLVAAARAKKLI
jgi:hypothetical protein